LGDGIELLLKARIEIHDWRLLFKDPALANREQYRHGTFESVTWKAAIQCLRKTCGVRIPKGQQKIISRVRSYRNQVRHHASRVDQATLNAVITKTYSFVLDFIAAEIKPAQSSPLGQLIERLRLLLSQFKAFVQARLEAVKDLLTAAYGQVVECPLCLQTSLHATGNGSECAFCGVSGKGSQMADRWVDMKCGRRRAKDKWMADDIQECPECYKDACVKVSGGLWHCFQCGEGGEYIHCERCTELYLPPKVETQRPATTGNGESIDFEYGDYFSDGDTCPKCWGEIMDDED
jgi:hypothetical protein